MQSTCTDFSPRSTDKMNIVLTIKQVATSKWYLKESISVCLLPAIHILLFNFLTRPLENCLILNAQVDGSTIISVDLANTVHALSWFKVAISLNTITIKSRRQGEIVVIVAWFVYEDECIIGGIYPKFYEALSVQLPFAKFLTFLWNVFKDKCRTSLEGVGLESRNGLTLFQTIFHLARVHHTLRISYSRYI